MSQHRLVEIRQTEFSSDSLMHKSLLSNLTALRQVALVPLNPKVLGSIPGAGTTSSILTPPNTIRLAFTGATAHLQRGSTGQLRAIVPWC
jgi:hypothetical protein